MTLQVIVKSLTWCSGRCLRLIASLVGRMERSCGLTVSNPQLTPWKAVGTPLCTLTPILQSNCHNIPLCIVPNEKKAHRATRGRLKEASFSQHAAFFQWLCELSRKPPGSSQALFFQATNPILHAVGLVALATKKMEEKLVLACVCQSWALSDRNHNRDTQKPICGSRLAEHWLLLARVVSALWSTLGRERYVICLSVG